MNLRVLFLCLLSIVLLPGGVAIYTANGLVNQTVLREAQYRTGLDLRSARGQLDGLLQTVQYTVEQCAIRRLVQELLEGKPAKDTRMLLERARIRSGLDILSICDSSGDVIMRTRHPYNTGGNRALDPLLEKALQGSPARGIILLYADELKAEGEDLPRAAFINVVPTPHAKPVPESTTSSGMMLWSAVPVYSEDQKLIGAMYGGILLNRNWQVVDDIRNTVFGDEKYDGKELGTVTIFLWDVRIATNVKDERGNRAIGTRVSAEVYDRVLENGMRWSNRAFVVNDWYISSYEPIRDPRDKIIGILYTGVLEKKYTDLRNKILRSFIGPVAAGILLSLLLALILAKMVGGPIRELAVASKHLADGDLHYRPRPFKSGPELQRLSESFARMSDAIEQRDEHLRQQNLALEESNQKLARLNRNYMEMLGFVSHELKNPLNSMIFGACSIRDGLLGPLNEKQKKIISTVLKNAEYLEEMIARYLDLSRIEKGELEVKKRDAPLRNDVVEPILEQLRNQIQAAGMQVQNKVADTITVFADPGLLRIVIGNLLSNAVKYGKEGRSIEISASETDKDTTVSVRNEGEGISQENLKLLFRKFVRLDHPAAKVRKGTGLGLFVSREIVEKHGGKIWAESEHGKWAMFSFTIPKQDKPKGETK